jgi:hypothetical protein
MLHGVLTGILIICKMYIEIFTLFNIMLYNRLQFIESSYEKLVSFEFFWSDGNV